MSPVDFKRLAEKSAAIRRVEEWLQSEDSRGWIDADDIRVLFEEYQRTKSLLNEALAQRMR